MGEERCAVAAGWRRKIMGNYGDSLCLARRCARSRLFFALRSGAAGRYAEAWKIVGVVAAFAFALHSGAGGDGARHIFSGEIARESQKFQQNSIFWRKSGGIGGDVPRWAGGGAVEWKIAGAAVVLCVGGWSQPLISRCAVFGRGRDGVQRILWRNRAKKPKILAKAGILGGNQAGLGWKCAAVGGWRCGNMENCGRGRNLI